MDRQSFIKEYNIRDAKPIDPSSRVLPAEGMACALANFINDRFRGVAKANARVSSYGGVLISAEYMAYFFKTLFAYVYGRCFLEIDITNDNDRMSILIRYNGELPVSDTEMRDLVRIARNAKTEILVKPDEINLQLKFEDAARRRVYAISVNDGSRIMLSTMGEIFYSGEYYPDKPADPPSPRAQKPKAQRKTNSKG